MPSPQEPGFPLEHVWKMESVTRTMRTRHIESALAFLPLTLARLSREGIIAIDENGCWEQIKPFRDQSTEEFEKYKREKFPAEGRISQFTENKRPFYSSPSVEVTKPANASKVEPAPHISRNVPKRKTAQRVKAVLQARAPEFQKYQTR